MFCYIQNEPTGLPTFQQSSSFVKCSFKGPKRNDNRAVNFDFSLKNFCKGMSVVFVCQISISLKCSKTRPIRVLPRIFLLDLWGKTASFCWNDQIAGPGALSSHLLCHAGPWQSRGKAELANGQKAEACVSNWHRPGLPVYVNKCFLPELA